MDDLFTDAERDDALGDYARRTIERQYGPADDAAPVLSFEDQNGNWFELYAVVPHYPTSAELAAFRHAYAEWTGAYTDGAPVHGGAFTHERVYGIGATDGAYMADSISVGDTYGWSRLMAGVERTAAANVPNECCSGYVWQHRAYCENFAESRS